MPGESLEFKTDELSVDEEKARAQKWCIDSVTGNVRRCTDPKEDAKKAKQDRVFYVFLGDPLGTFFLGLFNETLTELYGDADSTIDRC